MRMAPPEDDAAVRQMVAAQRRIFFTPGAGSHAVQQMRPRHQPQPVARLAQAQRPVEILKIKKESFIQQANFAHRRQIHQQTGPKQIINIPALLPLRPVQLSLALFRADRASALAGRPLANQIRSGSDSNSILGDSSAISAAVSASSLGQHIWRGKSVIIHQQGIVIPFIQSHAAGRGCFPPRIPRFAAGPAAGNSACRSLKTSVDSSAEPLSMTRISRRRRLHGAQRRHTFQRHLCLLPVKNDGQDPRRIWPVHEWLAPQHQAILVR